MTQRLLAAFNGGFKMEDCKGAYLSEGRQLGAFRTGGATLVIHNDGFIEIGTWNQTIARSSTISSAFQNLDLLVRNGAPVSGLKGNDIRVWGAAYHSMPNTPRSGIGVTANGALVYVYGKLTIVQLAKSLVAAGAVDAMTLDMNLIYPFFISYAPVDGVATSTNGIILDHAMGTAARIFQKKFTRSFVTLSLR
jgi:hypothetical protein